MAEAQAQARVAVSLVTYHSDLSLLRSTCQSLAASSVAAVATRVLVNDARGDEADRISELLRELGLVGLEVVSSPDNLGYAGGHNTNLRALFDRGATAALVLNPDVVLHPESIGELAAVALSVPMALLGPILERADRSGCGEGLIDTAGIRWTRGGRHLDSGQGRSTRTAPTRTTVVAGVSGACLLVPRGAFETMTARSGELFDEDFIAYREDAELGFRAALLGIPSVVVPQASGLHVRTQRGTVRGASAHIDRLGVRNRFLIAFKYGRHRPGGVLGPLLRDVVVVFGVLLRERSSLPGLVEAWQLRTRMREKGRRVLRQAVVSSHQATHPGL